MSRDTVVSSRYAKALFEAASDSGRVEETGQELKAVVDALTADHDFRNFIATPNISLADKEKVLENVFSGKISDALLRTLLLLIERGRYEVFPELLSSYNNIVSATLNIADARVYTPFPLTEQEQAEVAATFGQLSGKRLRIQNVIDESLIGGLKVVIGDKLYDGSVSGKLERLEKSFRRQA
ncbi:F0F1 ATP synthase subunit delta [Paenibacillus hunanensis]|uniref:ATP synthase subunit delta n=1 Tax=Paenibacillus hunanensis TaxID=539262 RepID=A0ABU1ITR5_9BACL|nr:F0F1 ATP synthase subunit delta [Paenibacillus hunanensis]MCL9661827.1 F0F1 ATP synthase subunit delta [Paenibacillus hunanensis]MDR6242649.1 F-type H+-transporting ATPase subunit delta [Paenibacillus hunanensis]WPP41985.1 F0F1 ATP synthase subunit delta [Paenibacillus hunanensis]GGJ01616.1 ATP synthase subunit delta [Paenibacillus hunanensis]